MLCREPKLAPSGRTRNALVVGLGDGADANVLIYGQRVGETETLKLCVGRRRPPPPPEKVRPGEPLPRGELELLGNADLSPTTPGAAPQPAAPKTHHLPR